MPRYFFGENAGRPIRAGGRQYAFEILGIVGGTHQGVVAVPDAEADAFLAVAARWVTEITEEAFNDAIQKKKTNRRLPVTPDLKPPAPLGPPLKGRGAVVVDGKGKDDPRINPTDKLLPEKIDDAVDLGRADAPTTEVQTPKPPASRRQNHREKRGNT